MLQDIFFTDLYCTPECTVAWHDKAPDYYSDLIAEINYPASGLDLFFKKNEQFLLERGRRPTFYVTPASRPKELPAFLESQGLHVGYRDA
jgi:hypothetical protein